MKSMLSQSVLIEESDDEVLDMLLDEAIPTDTVFPDGLMSVTDTIAQQAVYPEAHPVPPPNNNENDEEAVIHGNSRCDPGNKISAFFPFPDEKFFLLYCYAHRIMRPKSRVDLEFLWMLLDRLGVSMPSLDSILSFQIDGLENMLPVKKAYGDRHPFYWIPPSKHIKMQLATPHVAEQLNRYPKLTENKIQEMCQEVNNCLEFMCEILKVYVHRHMVTDYLVISEDLDVLKINEIDEICETPLAYKDVNGVIYSLTPEEIIFHSTAHPVKTAANGRQTLTLPLVIFLDETSGNRTKKWNKLETYSFFLASLPREEVTKFSNINFVCVSNLLHSETLGKVIAEDLLAEIFVQCPILCVSCDNPKASEICHHLGSTARHFCRDCDATSENAFQLGQPRTDIVVKSTVAQINNCRSERAKIMVQRDTGVSERGGQFDILKTFEACKQTPIEILHTILLGCEKYLLAKTMKTLSPANKKKVSARIKSFDFAPFPQKLVSNIPKTYGSLVGRDIKV
ncbi:Hypothetical predicted protein [Paramuricea clavata]|uniref:Uncharacterized protein n=1 Tax=Paramuricea clavata TaxID=317549 RepID=A0A7D9HIJ9_PARCT|nr:Hypothetical predicted protein [Paramuricea clavata]